MSVCFKKMQCLLQNMYGNKIDIKTLFCFEETNWRIYRLQSNIKLQVKIVWHFNTDKQIYNTIECRNQFIYLESIVEIRLLI